MPGPEINSEELNRFLSEDLGDFLSDTKEIATRADSALAKVTDGENIEDGIVKSLEGILDRGNSVLETMTIYCNNMPDAESVTAMAALLNALTGALSNVSSLYKAEQQHRFKIELEERKHELKLIEIEHREMIKAKARELAPGAGGKQEQADDMYEFNTNDIIDRLNEQE